MSWTWLGLAGFLLFLNIGLAWTLYLQTERNAHQRLEIVKLRQQVAQLERDLQELRT